MSQNWTYSTTYYEKYFLQFDDGSPFGADDGGREAWLLNAGPFSVKCAEKTEKPHDCERWHRAALSSTWIGGREILWAEKGAVPVEVEVNWEVVVQEVEDNKESKMEGNGENETQEDKANEEEERENNRENEARGYYKVVVSLLFFLLAWGVFCTACRKGGNERKILKISRNIAEVVNLENVTEAVDLEKIAVFAESDD